jgi:hypothetical protein
MKTYRQPDVKGPRYRKRKYNVLNAAFLEDFKKKYPAYKNVDNKILKNVIDTYNGVLWQMVIDEREGVEIPEGLGFLFIGSATAKSENPNRTLSSKMGVLVTHMNMETNNKICKILYTSYPSKYKFVNREVWTFSAVRQFKRTVSKAYLDNPNKYIVIDNLTKISNLYKKANVQFYTKKKEETLLESYDEFKID